MSDPDADAVLASLSHPEAAGDADAAAVLAAYANKETAPTVRDSAPVTSIVSRNPKMGRIDAKSDATAGDLTQAAASGINSGAMDLLGLPMDTASNVVDLGKAGIGTLYHATTGNDIPSALQIGDRSLTPGTSDWFKAQARRTVGANTVDVSNNSGQDLSALNTVGEVAGPGLLAEGVGATRGASAPRSTVSPQRALSTAAQEAVDRTVANSPQSMGAAAAAPNVAATSPELQQGIVREAQKSGGAINPEALSRHVEADSLPVPMQLTEGQALQDPAIISSEMNNRGKNPAMIARLNEQNGQLVKNVQAIRDQVGPEVFSTNPVEHGDTLIQAYKDRDAPVVADITEKYKALEDANGGQFPLDTKKFVTSTDAALSKALKTSSLPSDLAASLNEFRNGRTMTFEDFESLRSDAADAMRTAADGRQRAAAGIVRQQLENLPLTPEAAKLKPLADAARSAAKARFDALEADPAYDAAVHGTVPPDRFVQKFITGPQATRDGVATMRQNLADNETATQTMGVAAIDHLKRAAGISDMGEGNFSQAGFNKNFQAMGPKLGSLVDPRAAENLEKVGNVARYTQFQPRGSYVNNSNTLVGAIAEHAAGAAEGAANVAFAGVPVGSWVRKGVQNVKAQKAVERSLAPGAGLGRLSDVTKQ